MSVGLAVGSFLVIRGGSRHLGPQVARVANCRDGGSVVRVSVLGFRLVRRVS